MFVYNFILHCATTFTIIAPAVGTGLFEHALNEYKLFYIVDFNDLMIDFYDCIKLSEDSG